MPRPYPAHHVVGMGGTVAAVASPGSPIEGTHMSSGTGDVPRAPGTYREFVARFPELGEAHEKVARAVEDAGPLDTKTRALIKIGICLGAGLESATRAHVRRAAAAGASVEEMEQAIILGMNTCGFPKTVAAWRWMHIQLERNRRDAAGE
ncbi:MAG: carboxymuconolactone decarboxylase family protein [Acidimicrobiia bacterium]